MTKGNTFSSFGERQRDWLVGSNAWGSAFVVGAGETFPFCLQHQVANLAGNLHGNNSENSPLLLGAVVDGPSLTDNFNGLSAPDGSVQCPDPKSDEFKQFTGRGVRYQDNVAAWPSVEASDDYTVISLLTFARAAKKQQ